ncbi:MAG: S9 family peptidase [Crocinitomicaceae bacterium]|nr:S9 family peptidase [Crocinitomicaceae bacterium]MBP6033479.1 S9 family peptidase [Crocinitomicaceae bacterium]
MSKRTPLTEPIATQVPHVLMEHGHQRNDPYFWMNQRDSKEVLDNLQEENSYCEEYFEPINGLVQGLVDEFDARIDPNDVSSPFILQEHTYQIRQQEGKDYAILVRWEEDEEKVFLDENERAEGHSFYELAEWSPSLDDQTLAISEDFVGRRKYEIRFRKNADGTFYEDLIHDTDGSIVWANDHQTIFYIKKDPETLREYQVFRHQLGSKESEDVLVFQEDDERYYVSISKTIDNAFVLIACHSSTTSEISLVDANNPRGKAQVFLPRIAGHIYEVSHHETGFYVLSNDQAPNKKILFTATIPKELSECQEIVAHNPQILLEDISVFKDFILIEERQNGLRKLRIKTENEERYISFEEECYFLGLGVNDSYETSDIFYTYNSMTTPSSVFRYSVKTGEQSIWFEKKLLDAGFNSNDYQSERIWALANDGTRIPVSLVYKKGIDLAKAPCLLYGYGSYGYTLPDVFSATRVSLLNRGFIYAVAHIRGSKYMGEHWYEDGKFTKKINTFTDFINAAEYLSMKGYGDASKFYAQGGSAGGLLMGAVTNMAPYLWKGIISQVPFVDVVTTMLDVSIPLTTGEWEEWGNPQEEEFYEYMLKYSPYDNVRSMHYPAMFITTGYHDSQVQYWEPMKYVAKLRALRTNKNPLVFECNMDAGHGGGSGRSSERLEIAKVYAFILDLEDIHQ